MPKHRSSRLVPAAVVATLAATVLSGCGGSAYCDTVKENEKALNSFGQKRSDAAYTSYAKTMREIAKVSPDDVKKDWTALANVTEGVLAAQKDVGLDLKDMTDAAKVKKLDAAGLKKVNAAYEAFNKTTDQRNAVVKNVKQECKVTLK